MKNDNRIEAIHIVALGIDAERKRGTPEYAQAAKLKAAAVKQWKKQLWAKKTCQHCGKTT